ncbi:aliphatic sulfonate ABC transporter substrate-binding protein [Protaetiibacter mangrovi]|uniref:Aliphatic sulfonate ABC transporter substrate-binding protein n=1 Tax=Protaetiibacter mangrovi TaxID=2970926 RepID=A0ABT1ZBW9_9MICO|nr:aliphatic sulfonate ABC transporter substrate-binding protein [Protaetiibacter mangrovi]MCS0498193.1 aliphatic sulfonate ABC transporter substrate-binding protein [Protaetiibacter mangrovi]TPW93748.1 aliphatic sulfonate ABC transporter substrate-binding protein [Schumannella luteola]
MKKTILAAAAAVVAATLALSGCAGENATPAPDGDADTGWSTSTLNIDFATYNPLSLIIKDQGWLESTLDGVTVNWTQSLGSNKANEGLRAGALDVGSTAGSAALLARANGSPIRTIDIYTQPEWSALATLPGSGISSVADLTGKTVAVTVGTDPYFFLLQALDEAGVDVKDVNIQNLQHADGGTALVNGSVDAWSGLDPMMAAHEINDGIELFYRNVDFNTYGFLNATEDFVTNHADVAQVVVDAYEKARAWALENPDETAALLAEAAGIDQAVADKVLLERTTIDLDPVPGDAQLKVLKVVAPIQVANGDIPSQDAADQALDSLFYPDFAKKADASKVS